ncbi:class I SAM-dependent methyltransferase [Lentzea flava]|uniref:Methyltransferase type 11 n=1 Tax=Lentzea flava TaxID=103732 RepID=A0ABQ2UI62_9PSEU|nr:class I SAM-dependent methyltransferase [Lentzea flava]MCP2199285.1 Methyltransferase domain-containing protein [Lentzea flava]GGU36339.1 methyltransferase type 11 [Lentzea flava]
MKEIVENGYDAIARTYLTWSARITDDPRLHYLDQFDSRLADGAKILELGCGAGIPVTRKLAARHDVLGVDLSQQQIDLARANVPGARFEKADMTALDFPDGTFDGIAAFYSILHVPRADQPALIAKIARWLRPGGLFLASLGTGTPDVTETWLGVEMFFGSNTPEENRALLARHMEIVVDDLVTMHEPDPATFHWVLTRAREPRHPPREGAAPTG